MGTSLLEWLLFWMTVLERLYRADALSCWGKDAFNTSNQIWCPGQGFSEMSMSTCLYAIAQVTGESCTAISQCSTINMILDGQTTTGDGLVPNEVVSFAGCYKQTMVAYLCLGQQTLSTGLMTTDITMSVDMLSTGLSSTTLTSNSSTTYAPSTTTSTAASTTSTTFSTDQYASTISYPPVGSCLYGIVNLPATCTEGSKVRTFLMNQTGGGSYFNFTTSACCNDTDQCNNYGSRSTHASRCYVCDRTTSSAKCTLTRFCSACWAYMVTKGNSTAFVRDCSANALNLTSTTFAASSPSSCTGDYSRSVCQSTSLGTECLKCCTGTLCNGWTAVGMKTKAAPSHANHLDRKQLVSLLLITISLHILIGLADGSK